MTPGMGHNQPLCITDAVCGLAGELVSAMRPTITGFVADLHHPRDLLVMLTAFGALFTDIAERLGVSDLRALSEIEGALFNANPDITTH
jgi:hypothetical protein